MTIITLISKNDKLMWDIWMSMYQLSAVTVADEIGLFTLVEKTKQNIDTISTKLNIHVQGVKALTNLLVALKFLNQKNKIISLTEISKSYLLPGSPFYWGPQFQGLRERIEHKRLIKALDNSATQLNFENKSLSDMWENGSLTDNAANDFTRKMHATIFAPALGAVKSGVFAPTKKLLDMGGGSGCFCIAYIRKYPKNRSAIFELPAVCKVADKYLQESQLMNKIDILPGNFFKDKWPNGYDGILFSQIFHDWPVNQCKLLAKYAYESLPTGGHIYIHEMLLDDNDAAPLTVSCFNLLMLINHQSQQFSKKELFKLLRHVGFKNLKSKKTFGYYTIITGKK
jgi:hypothetical protein